MTMRGVVDVLPQAIDEAREARSYYVSKSAAAEEGFRKELENAVALIREYPETWPTYVHGTRRFVLRRFPYSIVYRTDGRSSLLVAIAHAKRKPGYWRSRLSAPESASGHGRAK
jgi:plasmid stabilization system protein ParE